jgi:hypothetical protein
VTPEEIGFLLGDLQDHYGTGDFTDRMFEDWWNEFQNDPSERMRRALRAVFAEENFHPDVDRFRQHVDRVKTREEKTARAADECGSCDGSGWLVGQPEERVAQRGGEPYTVTYETMYPCPGCRSVQHERWSAKGGWADQAAKLRRRQEVLLPANPQKGLADARSALANAAGLLKNAKNL